MRLDRLDLVRYGKFTGRSLDFGAPRPGRPDFHLVYGPNEAGKSTLFSAYLDLLFGIELKSTYGFLHPYPLMRVGGLVSIDGTRHEAFRLKRNQGSLVSADDRPLPDGLFSQILGGMDRTAYRTMFSLDDESIEKGGEDILRSEGELGAMLFSASSGLSDLASGLAALKTEADEFYRPQARKHGLAALKADIETLREERKDLDVAARDYAALVRARDAAAERHQAATAARSEARAALGEMERSLAALPVLARLRALRADLAGFEPGDSPPAAWRSLVGELAREEVEIAARATRVAAERLRSAGERAALPEDDAILAAEADIAALAGSALEARFRTAAMDLAAREAERDRAASALAAGLATLGLPPGTDPATVVLPPDLADTLTTLLSRRATLAERAETALREQAEADKALEAANIPMEEETGRETLSALNAAIRAARSGDLSARLRETRRRLALAAQEGESSVARLAPWSGPAATLEAMSVPSAAEIETLRRWQETAAEVLRRQADDVAALDRDVTAARARLDALRRDTGAVGEEEIAGLRGAREEAWLAHLARLDRESAAAFEETMRADDRARDMLLRHADRLSEIRVLERTIAEDAARLAALSEETARLERARAEIGAEIAACASGLGLPEGTTLADVTGWLERRITALEKLRLLAQQQVEADLVETEARGAGTRLAMLLGREGVPLEEALFLAEDRLEALKAAEARHLAAGERLARAKADAGTRRKAAEDAASALAAWRQAWDRAIVGTWLASEADPDRLAARIPALQALGQNAERRREFDHRIAAMRRDQADYGDHARRLAERLGEPFEADDPLSTVAALTRRLDAAKAVRERRAAADTALARLDEEEKALDERRTVLAARLSEIFAFLGCDSLAEAEIRLDAFRRRDDLLDRIAEAGRDLVQRLRAETLDEAEAQLAAVDEAQLAAERADLLTRLDALDRTVQEEHAARAKAIEALDRVAGSDEAAALEVRRRTALLEIAERSRRYLATRAGVMAAEQALRLYRERHRSAMMERASGTFRAITGGEYAGLSTMVEKESEFLVANAASGGSKLAKDLSKGTRFQLYLALRVAGYHEIAASRETVPFIADDIMETFDDGRALNALRVLTTMAGSGQVIYLTHHEHLCALAREACPDVVVHRL